MFFAHCGRHLLAVPLNDDLRCLHDDPLTFVASVRFGPIMGRALKGPLRSPIRPIAYFWIISVSYSYPLVLYYRIKNAVEKIDGW